MNDPRSTRSLVIRLIGVGLLLPLLAAAVLVWSTQDRQENLTKVPVAIVNNDKIITSPQPMAAGRALSASLTNPKDSDPALDWHLTTSDDAKDGLRTGDFYAVLTIPEDFSSAILSTGTDKPESGQLSLVSNAAASTTVPYISHQVVAAAATALGNQSTQGYLKNVYAGFNKIASSNQQAASSAGQLAQGTSELSTCLDRNIEAFVFYQASDGDIVIAAWRVRWREEVKVNGRVDDDGFAVVELLKAAGDKVRVGDIAGWALGGL